jgi:GrpB-like predicted nucleotidyltransferase (UPF0157 family)
MPAYNITRKSRPVIVSEYGPQWAAEFTYLARPIRGLVGSAAIRIDHIGSTAGPGLAAKDVIDLQVTVADLDSAEMREPEGERRAHIRIRELWRFNQRYALPFRDYLRASEAVRKEYEVVKRRATTLFPDSIGGYLFLKYPVFHIIYEAACLWSRAIG